MAQEDGVWCVLYVWVDAVAVNLCCGPVVKVKIHYLTLPYILIISHLLNGAGQRVPAT